ncbi:YggT family protein [Tsukamurella paurometabola]|uniref:YGGT family n=1 Tax=Tsukamurella paurometabola TaxID=2061 RepID=A0A3P8KIQ1_TSUPA|nr:YggT family protein [Tsukamurella paurometabola]MBS4100088.1 YggT family protein [Tsukamurella paurometabola]UEA83129.1 YggT family protein [Tsukamurella paurometabola]VDR40218.1 YGGT family [Tsukamurella paurometabola]
MQAFWLIVIYLLSTYSFLLLIRLVIEVVKSFAREWYPSGFLAVLLEALFTVTDPPLKLLRKLIPPVTLGPVRLDLSYIVLFLLLWVARELIYAFAF